MSTTQHDFKISMAIKLCVLQKVERKFLIVLWVTYRRSTYFCRSFRADLVQDLMWLRSLGRHMHTVKECNSLWLYVHVHTVNREIFIIWNFRCKNFFRFDVLRKYFNMKILQHRSREERTERVTALEKFFERNYIRGYHVYKKSMGGDG